MKKTFPYILLSCLAILPVHAQTNNTPSSDTAQNQQPPPPPPHGGPMANLTQEERAQLKAAHDKAIQQDPSLDQKLKSAHQAMEEARKAMHDAMIKVDPTVEPILQKMAPPKWHQEARQEAGTNSQSTNAASMNTMQQEGHGMPPGFASLTPDEQARLKAAHEQAKNDGNVIAAKALEKNAVSPQDRHAAREALHKAMHDAMMKADPTIEPLLAKLHPQGQPSQPGGGGEMMQQTPQ